MTSFGFEIAREESREVKYAANQHSMMKTAYNCAFFSAVKPGGSKPVTLYQAPGSVRVLPEGSKLEGKPKEKEAHLKQSNNQQQEEPAQKE